MNEPTGEERMRAARSRAQWELGDPNWASVILNAYLHPREDAERLKLEKTAMSEPHE